MKSSQSIRLYRDKEAVWQLLYIGVLFLYCVNPAMAWIAATIPPADHESILYALRTAKLTSFANVLDGAIIKGGFLVPPSATIFVPTNSAVDGFLLSNPNLINLCSNHMTTKNYFFNELTSLPIGTQIPTILSNNTLLVTDNNPSNFHINNNKLMAPDLCTIQTVACYAIDAIFNNTIWDQAAILAIPRVLTPTASPLLPHVGASGIPPIGSPLTSCQAPFSSIPLPPTMDPSSNSSLLRLGRISTPSNLGGVAPFPSSTSTAVESKNQYKHLMVVVVAIITIIFI